MHDEWSIVLYLPYLSIFIALAAIIKNRIPLFRRYIVPTAILAGFIGMFLGPEFLNLIPINSNRLGTIVYHSMAIGFIALSLKSRKGKASPVIMKSGFLIVSVYMLQGIIGLMITLIFMNTVRPDLFIGFGLLLPLGFGQGPGQAFSMGTQWEGSGFVSGGNIGLTIATLGFLWAILIGIPYMNYQNKRNKLTQKSPMTKKEHIPYTEASAPEEIPLGDALDKITTQVVMIGLIYLITYLTILGLSNLISPLGTFGMTFVNVLWGMHFNIAAGYAILTRLILNKLQDSGLLKEEITNNYLLQRISGGVFDFMITASVAAISINAFVHYLVPVMLMTTLGGVATLYYLKFISKRVYKENTLENLMGFYGMLTGTISTGMALLRGADPGFDTDASSNLVFGSAVGMAFGIPLLVVVNLPIVGYLKGQPIYYFLTLGILVVYMLILIALMLRNSKKITS